MTGRPKEYDREAVSARILEGMRGGRSLVSLCKEEGLSHSTFLAWVAEDKDLSDKYTRARETGADAEFERLLEMADAEPERTERGVDSGWVQWQRMRVDTMKWALSKKAPRKYGERLDLKHSGSVGLQINIDVSDTDDG